jgi:MFS family permease
VTSTPAPLLSGPFLRVTLANFFFFLNFAAFFLLPLQVKELGGSESTVGAVMGTGGVATFLSLPVVGLTIDRLGRRLFLLGGTAMMATASALFLLVDHIGPLLFLLRALQGVSFGMAFTAATTLAAEHAPRDRRARALGIFGVSTLLTHALAPGLGEELVRWAGFEALFAAATVCTGVSLLLAIRLPAERRRSVHDPLPAPWRLDGAQWLLGSVMVLCGLGFGAVVTFIPTFVRSADLGRVGFFYFSYTLTAISTRLVGAGISDTFGRRAVILPTLAALGLSIFLLAGADSVLALGLTGAFFGVAQGINYPTLHAYLIDITPEDHLGRAQALFNGAFNLGVTSAAFVFGWAAHHFGHRPMFLMAGAMPLVAIAVMLAVPGKKRG